MAARAAVALGVVLIGFFPTTSDAQDCPTCQYYGVTVTPDGGYDTDRPKNSSGHTMTFTVTNTGNLVDTYTFTCVVTGGVTCTNINPAVKTLNPAQQWTVTVTYSVGASGGQLTLDALGEADVNPGHDTGYRIVTTPPVVTLVVPRVTTNPDTALVRSRTPLVVATFSADAPIDLNALVLKIGADTVTKLSRRNAALLEWEVDPAHQLTPGVAQSIYVRVCHVNSGCTAVLRCSPKTGPMAIIEPVRER